jgi:hypothetical protein
LGERIKSLNDDSCFYVMPEFEHGSFTVKFESKIQPNMFGFSKITQAFEKIDELTSKISDPDKTFEIVQRNAGHLAGAYIKLLENIFKYKTGIRYYWASPESTKSHSRVIDYDKKRLQILFNLFKSKRDITIEHITLIGKITSADAETNEWKIRNEENGEVYSGKVKSNSPASLSGTVIVTQKYELHCEEIIKEALKNGKEVRERYLIDFKPIKG